MSKLRGTDMLTNILVEDKNLWNHVYMVVLTED